MALVFEHQLLHEGSMLVEGRKYCIRTDVMFTERSDTASTVVNERAHLFTARALSDCTATDPGELSFSQGDTIAVLSTEGDWWMGTLRGRNGVFHANCVERDAI